MKKNRFSTLLKNLMNKTELKNYILAQELQYDVSYISKWTSGHVLPPEKSVKQIVEGISRCIVQKAEDDVRDELRLEYAVDSVEELWQVIRDNLMAEYRYVKELQKNTGLDVANELTYYPEISLSRYIKAMQHPALFRVSSLEVIAVMDIMAMSKDNRRRVVEGEHTQGKKYYYSSFHYSLVIHIEYDEWDYVGDTIFLLNLLDSRVDFNIYEDIQAIGKVAFVVNGEYSVLGMLVDQETCISVTMNEERQTSKILYNKLEEMCSREKSLFYKLLMCDMIQNRDYIQTILSMNQRWVVGHITEHFISIELFDEIVKDIDVEAEIGIELAELRKIHIMTRKVMREEPIKLMLCGTALYNLLINKELDFYNYTIHFTSEQLLHCYQGVLRMCMEYDNIEVRLISEKMIMNFDYEKFGCIFLNDMISYIRLDDLRNHLRLIKKVKLKKIFDGFFDTMWNYDNGLIVSDREEVVRNIESIMRGIDILCDE